MRVLLTALTCAGLLAGSASAQFTTSTQQPGKAPSVRTPGVKMTSPGTTNPGGSMSLLGPGGSDDCATAQAVGGDATVPFDLTTATTGAQGQNEFLCYFFGQLGVTTDVWFAWTPTSSGTAIVTTCGLTTVDTKIAAYNGAACPVDGTAIACNDDACGLQSSIQFAATSGNTYMIQVGTFPGATAGTGSVSMTVGSAASNDECATPTVIAGEGFFAYDNTLATTSAQGQVEGLCYEFGSTDMQRDVWFTWTPSATGTAIMRTCGTTVDTKIAAYPGAGCPANGTALACNDDACGFQSSINFPVTAGNTYTLQVGVFPGAGGGNSNFELLVTNPPTNDGCATPTAIAGQGTFAFDSTVATTGAEGQAEGLCYFFGSTTIDNDLWYSWTADATGLALLSTCGLTTVDTKAAVYAGTGCPTSGSSIACNDDACGFQTSVAWDVTSGSTYTVQLGTFPGATGGSGGFDITIITPPDCYTLDLGTSNNSVGLTAGGDMVMMHGFTAGGGSDVITQIEAAYGTPAFPGGYSGGNIVVAIWDDPTNDFDPSDAVLLYTQPAIASGLSIDSDVFQVFAIPSVPVSGVFFIGVMFDNHFSGEFPGGLDQTLPGGQAVWVYGDTTGNADLTNTLNNDVPPLLMDSIGLPGRWMLRAVGPNCNTGSGVGTAFCNGDGSGTLCPCGNQNDGSNGVSGCANSAGAGGGKLVASGSPSISAADLVLAGSTLQTGQAGLYLQGNNATGGGNGVVFGDGLRCAGGGVVRLQVRNSGMTGSSFTTVNIGAIGGVSAGQTKRYQLWFRDTAGPCGSGFNFTNGLEITWAP